MFDETIDPIPDIDEAMPAFNAANDATIVAVWADTDVDNVIIDVPNDVANEVNLLGTPADAVAALFKDDTNTFRDVPIPTNPTVANNDAALASFLSALDTEAILELTFSPISLNAFTPLARPVKLV